MFLTGRQQKNTLLNAHGLKQKELSANHTSELREGKRKMETKQSSLSNAMRMSYISDYEYTTSIYQWRKQQKAPIVRVIQLAKRNQIDQSTGLQRIHNIIRPQPIYCKLNNFRQFSKQELLLIFNNMIQGHRAIFKKMKATSVSIEKCVVTAEGKVKVWINQQFQRNDISGQILTKQQNITKRIFQTLNFIAKDNNDNKLKDFIQYIQSSIMKNGKWSFVALKSMLKSYVDCLKIKLPEILNINIRFEKRPMQSSMIQQKPFVQSRFRKSSFDVSNKNGQSLLNCQYNSILNSSNNNIKDSSLYFSTLPGCSTSKSIGKRETSPTLKHLTKTIHTNSISRISPEVDQILECSKYQGRFKANMQKQIRIIQQHRKYPSINDILYNKIGFVPLPQKYEQESSSPSAKKELNNQQKSEKSTILCIASQFNLTIQTQNNEKNYKASSISTTNQTSASNTQFCFAKKIQQSYMTINSDEKQNLPRTQQFRTASRDRFKQIVSKTQQTKKAVGSCTNWSSYRNPFDLSCLNDIHVSQISNTLQLQGKNAQKNNNQIQQLQLGSIKGIDQENKLQIITPAKSSKKLIKQYLLKNPLSLLNQLKSEQQLQSYQNTEKNSSCESPSRSVRKIKQPIQQKILELINMNKKLVISTYMETSSQKKIKDAQTPDKERQRRIKDIQETLAELVKANLKQQQIIVGNCWTKRLQNLLGIEEELKESISFGPEQANALLRQIKLSKIGKCGRQIENSIIP